LFDPLAHHAFALALFAARDAARQFLAGAVNVAAPLKVAQKRRLDHIKAVPQVDAGLVSHGTS